ncbi:MAG TPA: flagellar biosynthesis anti-sigma factor FlgM [Planctomycetes bacterium]|nr:flagellar biosynthesis anti-sigma factor FlgM [Planctomycetota bacterium]HIN80297.1 flagellar biosynthesis anti-sigma factor FlgM [Planctomycetota bacterium]
MTINETGGIGAPQPAQPEKIQPAKQVGNPLETEQTDETRVAGGIQRGADDIQISTEARLLQQLSELPEIREDKVEEVRRKIADGEYDKDEYLQAAIERMIEESI